MTRTFGPAPGRDSHGRVESSQNQDRVTGHRDAGPCGAAGTLGSSARGPPRRRVTRAEPARSTGPDRPSRRTCRSPPHSSARCSRLRRPLRAASGSMPIPSSRTSTASSAPASTVSTTSCGLPCRMALPPQHARRPPAERACRPPPRSAPSARSPTRQPPPPRCADRRSQCGSRAPSCRDHRQPAGYAPAWFRHPCAAACSAATTRWRRPRESLPHSPIALTPAGTERPKSHCARRWRSSAQIGPPPLHQIVVPPVPPDMPTVPPPSDPTAVRRRCLATDYPPPARPLLATAAAEGSGRRSAGHARAGVWCSSTARCSSASRINARRSSLLRGPEMGARDG